MNRLIPRISVEVLLVLSLALAGCGNDQMRTAVVKGQVTYKGKPVPNGTVLFIPKVPGPTATGELSPDGTFSHTTYKKGDGAVLGTHRVVISAMEDTSHRLPEQRNPLPPPIVPDKYTSAATTDLEVEVQVGENNVTFELKDGRKR
jgi:hypothetical protein